MSIKASVKLKQMIDIKWTNWLRKNVESRVRELEVSLTTNVFNFLKGTITTPVSIEITPKGIEELLRNGYMFGMCQNPQLYRAV